MAQKIYKNPIKLIDDEFNELAIDGFSIDEMKKAGIDIDSQAEIRHYLNDKFGLDDKDQIELVRKMGFTPFEEENWR